MSLITVQSQIHFKDALNSDIDFVRCAARLTRDYLPIIVFGLLSLDCCSCSGCQVEGLVRATVHFKSISSLGY